MHIPPSRTYTKLTCRSFRDILRSLAGFGDIPFPEDSNFEYQSPSSDPSSYALMSVGPSSYTSDESLDTPASSFAFFDASTPSANQAPGPSWPNSSNGQYHFPPPDFDPPPPISYESAVTDSVYATRDNLLGVWSAASGGQEYAFL